MFRMWNLYYEIIYIIYYTDIMPLQRHVRALLQIVEAWLDIYTHVFSTLHASINTHSSRETKAPVSCCLQAPMVPHRPHSVSSPGIPLLMKERTSAVKSGSSITLQGLAEDMTSQALAKMVIVFSLVAPVWLMSSKSGNQSWTSQGLTAHY